MKPKEVAPLGLTGLDLLGVRAGSCLGSWPLQSSMGMEMGMGMLKAARRRGRRLADGSLAASEPGGRARGPREHSARQRGASDVVSKLKADDFYRDTHQTLYRAIRDLYDLGKPIDGLTLSAELTHRGEFETIGGHETLSEIVESVPHAANARYYADIDAPEVDQPPVDRER